MLEIKHGGLSDNVTKSGDEINECDRQTPVTADLKSEQLLLFALHCSKTKGIPFIIHCSCNLWICSIWGGEPRSNLRLMECQRAHQSFQSLHFICTPDSIKS